MSYRKSKRTVRVTGDPSKTTGRLYVRLLEMGENPADRQAAAQNLVDALGRDFGTPPLSVQVLDRPQPHSLSPSPRTGRPVVRWQEYGDYRETVRSGARIRIYNLTPRRRHPVSIRMVAETALHEFMHHYDYHVLGLNYSFHTSGFFQRIRDLRRRLLPPGGAS